MRVRIFYDNCFIKGFDTKEAAIEWLQSKTHRHNIKYTLYFPHDSGGLQTEEVIIDSSLYD